MIHSPKPSVGPHDTTVDWQALARPVVILPVGSLEQHGAHMPLSTDSVIAEYFAEYLAGQLGCARLPVLPIAQSYEHTGFRGSVSLRPETFMAVLRDIVDQLESQNFTRLIILNAHGGNFALPTVVRDINRQRRAIRVMRVHWSDYCTEPFEHPPGGDVHAAGMETSVMMAIRPDLVGVPSTDNPVPLPEAQVPDLNHFGLGVLRPAGPWGDVTRADPQWGRRAVEGVKAGLLEAVRQRLGWFDEHPVYEGAGPVVVRPMVDHDVPAAMQLIRTAGWDQTEADWRMLLSTNPRTCIAAVHNGRMVGTTSAACYGDAMAWIGMVLVDPSMRRRGIGRRMMDDILELTAHCPTVRLDATPLGYKLYETMGFETDYTLGRYAVQSMPEIASPSPGLTVAPMTAADLDDVTAMDCEAFGFERRPIVEFLFGERPERAVVCRDGSGRLTGFALGRAGHAFDHVGPVTACDLPSAQALCGAAFAALRGRPVILDCPHAHAGFTRWIESIGFAQQRQLIRMTRGRKLEGENLAVQFAIASPAIG